MKSIILWITIILSLSTYASAENIELTISDGTDPTYSWTGGNISELYVVIPTPSYASESPYATLEARLYPETSKVDFRVIESSGSYDLDEHFIEYAKVKYKNELRTENNKILVFTLKIHFSEISLSIWEVKSKNKHGMASPLVHGKAPLDAIGVLSPYFKLKPEIKYQLIAIRASDGQIFTKDFIVKESQAAPENIEKK